MINLRKSFRYTIYFFTGSFLLAFLSIFQKMALGAEPFAPTGFIVPVFFGGFVGVFFGIFQSKAKEQRIISEVLNDISRAALTDISLVDLYQLIHDSIKKIIQVNNFFIALYDGDDTITFPYYCDESDDEDEPAPLSLRESGSLTGISIKKAEPVLFSSKEIQTLLKSGEMQQHGPLPDFWMGIPMKLENEIIGVLVIQSYEEASNISDKLFPVFSLVADYAAAAIKRKKAEHELRDNRTRLDLILKTVQSGIILVDKKDKTIRYANPVALELMGRTEDEVIGSECHEFICPSSCGDCPVIDNDEKVDKSEKILLRKNGEKLDILKSIASVDIGGSSYLLECFLDISEQKQAEQQRMILEEQLIQAQKMEAVGRLAGGIAHDFNNILTSTMGYAELLAMKFSDETSSEGRAASIILRNSIRAANLTKQLLGYARKGKFNPVSVEINKLILEVLSVTEKIFEKRVTVNLDLNEVSNVLADKNQIDQVLTNIFINAKDAISGTGDLFISTEPFTLHSSSALTESGMKPGAYVKVSVRDTGAGINDEIKKHIFDPFFTTKSEGKGSGLGLATVYGIIKNHYGHVEVESELNVGTVFHLYLPATTEETDDADSISNGVVKGNATVLVIDDEDDIRGLSEEVLSHLGYKVLVAEDGSKGVEVYREHRKEIELVLLDMIMPNMNGEETLEKIISIDPDAKVILMSGFSEKGISEMVEKDKVSGFVQKPFGIQDVSSMIDSVLHTQN